MRKWIVEESHEVDLLWLATDDLKPLEKSRDLDKELTREELKATSYWFSHDRPPWEGEEYGGQGQGVPAAGEGVL